MINLYHLKYFADAAKAGGISESARLNFLTQSAISRAIAKLEEDLGVELFLHRQNHFQITEAGEAILKQSPEIFGAIASLKNTATSYTKSLRGPLRVGCNQAIVSKLLGPALAHLEQKYPDIIPDVKLGNTDQVQKMVDDVEIDLGIVVADGEVEKLYQTQTVYSGKFVIVKSPKFKKPNPFDHLIVSRTKKGGLSQRYFREFEKTYRKTLTPKLVVSSWQVIMDLAASGFGCALVPEFLCEDALKNKSLELVSHKVKAIPFELCTIVGKGRALPKNAQALLEWFR